MEFAAAASATFAANPYIGGHSGMLTTNELDKSEKLQKALQQAVLATNNNSITVRKRNRKPSPVPHRRFFSFWRDRSYSGNANFEHNFYEARDSGSSLVNKTEPSTKVYLNVGGDLFITFKRTLKSIPGTRLFYLIKTPVDRLSIDEYDPATGHYFFDRHPGLFVYILNYYRTGKLHVPRDICWPLFEQELNFWGIDESHLETCCWMVFRHHRDNQDTLAILDDEDDKEKYDYRKAETSSNFQKVMANVWETFDDPMSSKISKFVALISLTCILISVLIFCLETHEMFQVKIPNSPTHRVLPDVNITHNSTSSTPRSTRKKPVFWLFYAETFCVAYFTVEIIIRIISCPNKCVFIRAPLNIIDFLAILPYFFDLVSKTHGSSGATGALRVVRVCRVFRVLKLTRHSTGLRILWHTLRASMKELVILGVFMGIGVVIFASLVYYAERLWDQENVDTHFVDIPKGFWWAVVTMTTLGYGDMVPKTLMGQTVGAICALCGLLTIALPVPVIVSNFTLYYNHYQARMKLRQHRKLSTGSSQTSIGSRHIASDLCTAADKFDHQEAERRSMLYEDEEESAQKTKGSSANQEKVPNCVRIPLADESNL